MTGRPRILLSGCLAGHRVRYDGSDKRDDELLRALDFAELVPLCPEAGAGLGVPRPPIRLVLTSRGVRLRRVDDPAVDVTDRLEGWGREQLAVLAGCDGVILKSRSPSCGVRGVPRLLADGREDEAGVGHFAALVRTQFPDLPLADERELRHPGHLAGFIGRVQEHFARRGGRHG